MAAKQSSQLTEDMKEPKISSSELQTLKAGTPGSNNIILPGCKILLITFADSPGVDVSHMEFSNRYSGSVMVFAKYREQQPGGNIKFQWKKLVAKTLMPNPHYAAGAESKFVLKSTEFVTEPKDICALKFILQQPSVHFTEFAIDNLKVYSTNHSEVPSDLLTEWITKRADKDSPKHNSSATIRDFPPLDKVSSTLQRMWALGKKKNSIGLTIDSIQPKRFDKDGCYDINLLTY